MQRERPAEKLETVHSGWHRRALEVAFIGQCGRPRSNSSAPQTLVKRCSNRAMGARVPAKSTASHRNWADSRVRLGM